MCGSVLASTLVFFVSRFTRLCQLIPTYLFLLQLKVIVLLLTSIDLAASAFLQTASLLSNFIDPSMIIAPLCVLASPGLLLTGAHLPSNHTTRSYKHFNNSSFRVRLLATHTTSHSYMCRIAPRRFRRATQRKLRRKLYKQNRPRVDPSLGSYDNYIVEHFHVPEGVVLAPKWNLPTLPSTLLHDFVTTFNPAAQFTSLVDIATIGSTGKRRLRKLHRTALIAAANLSGIHSSSTSTPEIYISRDSTEELPIVIDTGASFSVTPNVNDFIGQIQPSDLDSLKGLNSDIKVFGQGTVQWTIQDVLGNVRKLQTTAYYVPDATIRLFSPQVYLQDNPTTTFRMTGKDVSLTLTDNTMLQFPFQPKSNLPLMMTPELLKSQSTFATRAHLSFTELSLLEDQYALSNIFSRTNINLSSEQKELLLWHQRLGHLNQQRIQSLLAIPRDEHTRQILKPRNPRASSCPTAMCQACQYAKQKRRQPETTKHTPINQGTLDANILKPGQRVSADQYYSSVRGRLPHTKGKESETDQYCGGTIFVDHATDLVYHQHQIGLTAAETVHSKHTFEQFADSFAVKIQEYVTDNQPFKSAEFVNDLKSQGQTQHLSGVGAHHQNKAERTIQTIMGLARAMLLHFAIHWPSEANLSLWPYAVDQATWIWNNTPRTETRLSPMELFTGVTPPHYHHLQRTHVFGSPTYVLDPTLQDGKKLPKWKLRSRQGIYLGYSPLHSTTVSRVLNPDTGTISNQYHCVHDDHFATVTSNGNEPFLQDIWDSLVISNLERHESIQTDNTGRVIAVPPDTSLWDTPTIPHRNSTERALQDLISDQLQRGHSPNVERENTPPPISLPTSEPPLTIPPPAPDPVTSTFDPTPADTPADAPLAPLPTPPQQRTPTVTFAPETPAAPVEPRRSSRSTKGQPASRLINEAYHICRPTSDPRYSKQTVFQYGRPLPRVRGELLNNEKLMSLNWERLLHLTTEGTLGSFLSEAQKETIDGCLEYFNPALFATLANKEDNPTWEEAMRGPDRAGYLKACEIELQTLNDLNVFTIVKREDWMSIVSSVWAFKKKRYPSGEIRKLKARFCARGFEQKEGIDYFETYAPVVNWQTVRLLLMSSILLNLSTKQIDYTAAFVQAEIDTDVYVQMPRGFEQQGKVYKLNKCLYGLKQSPRNYFLHLKSKLESVGLEQSDADPCLFIGKDIICLIYVDDQLIFGKDSKSIDDLISKLRKQEMPFDEEDDVAGFLGVHIDRRSDGSIELTQKGLISNIVTALNIDKLSPSRTPAKVGFLSKDKDGDPAECSFNYASVIGMMQYLQGHSRPDITMAVSQCSRFTHNPKRSHELALVRIGQYLKGTADKGLILRPQPFENTFTIDIYVDAAFAVGWGYEDPNDPSCCRSRTGYLIEAMGCPIVWISKLQNNISTSTMESEYTALSMALRTAIPLQSVAKSIIRGLTMNRNELIIFKTTAHEDNEGALKLAQLEPGRTTPRSKFYALKMHWFRSWLKPNSIELQYINTKLQKADMLTKSLSAEPFEINRKLSCGW